MNICKRGYWPFSKMFHKIRLDFWGVSAENFREQQNTRKEEGEISCSWLVFAGFQLNALARPERRKPERRQSRVLRASVL